MPDQYTIITENDESQWNDDTGIIYHFPERYLKYIKFGTKVIYYKGKQKSSIYSSQRISKEPHYFGLATIGEVTPDENHSKNYYASILDYIPFVTPVTLRDSYGTLYEVIPPSRVTNYWRDGVRPITQEIYKSILSAFGIDVDDSSSPFDVLPVKSVRPGLSPKPLLKMRLKNLSKTSESAERQFYSPNAKKIGDRGEQIVYDFLRENLIPEEAHTVRWLALEGLTPGYDIQYHNLKGETICIEVKSTTAKAFSQFLFTSNELKAAEAHKENYIIYLVSDCLGASPMIDLLSNPFIQLEHGSLVLEPIAFKVSRKEQDGSTLETN